MALCAEGKKRDPIFSPTISTVCRKTWLPAGWTASSFLIEYDNTQNNANHIHSVWRDLRDDWGEHLLRNHYKESHSMG